MRRSNSLSSIPLPTSRRDSRPKERTLSSLALPTSKRDSRAKERTLSVASQGLRYSRERSTDAATPLLSHNRLCPPSGNRISAQKHVLWTPSSSRFSNTPTFSGGYKRSNPSTIGSRMSAGVSVSKSPAVRRKQLQQNLSNKKWLAEKYSIIQDYIATSGLFDAGLAGSLRPPTIAIFVELITKLLKQIVEIGPVNTTNYGDIVITNLKLLRYPGQITNSVVKTINTLHAWPHFIAIISFLLEKADLVNVGINSNAQLDEECKVEYDLQEVSWSFWYMEETEPNLSQIKSDIITLTGTDLEAVQILEERKASEQLEFESIHAKLEEKRKLLDEFKAKNLERQQTIDQYEKNKGNREKEVKEEVRALKKKEKYQKEKINELQLAIKDLENVISNQTFNVEQKEEIIKTIEELKRLIERRQMNATKLRQQHQEMDIIIGNAVIDIERKVDKWNVAIKQTLLPELKDLKLREKGFHKSEFLEELLEIKQIKINLYRKLTNEYKENELKIKKLQKLKESMADKNQSLSSARKEVDNLRKKLYNLEEKKQTMVSDFIAISRDHDLKVGKSLEKMEAEIKQQELIIQTLTTNIQKQIEETHETKKRGVEGIIRAHNAALTDFQEINTMKHRMLKNVGKAHKRSTQQLAELFEHYLKMQESTAKLYGSLEDKENIE
ncbi:unnamed protein product [Ceutorhynchus assimilis]|uniref:Kinetochore protein NDC80 n=1 Tax=Ceutorhynchus assimilis TaxID=467358 RepID=A0A9N9MZK5_9CUCU|nr:unnamed protein product [Ceutorhynchus assimilis]